MNPVSDAGKSSPLGATTLAAGVNFSLFSRSATGVELLLFDREDDSRPGGVIPIDPALNRTYHYWHVFVPGVRPGQIYGYRAQGPYDPANGMRFDPAKVLLDPYGRGVVVPNNYSREAVRAGRRQRRDRDEERRGGSVRVRLGRRRALSTRPRGPSSTRRTSAVSLVIPVPASRSELRGTFAGLIEKIPYLQQLGITAVELLPVFQFDAHDSPPGLVNYWGYAPVSFLRRTTRTARVRIRSGRPTSSATWSRHCIEQASKSSST